MYETDRKGRQTYSPPFLHGPWGLCLLQILRNAMKFEVVWLHAKTSTIMNYQKKTIKKSTAKSPGIRNLRSIINHEKWLAS